MTLALIIGLALTGTAVALIARAIALPRIQAVERLQRIASYGAPEAAEAVHKERRVSAGLDRLAERLGGALIPRLGDGEGQVRAFLASAGMYGTTPGRFLGYRSLCAAGALVGWLWLASLAHVPAVLFLIVIPLMAASGWVLPSAIVRRRADERQAAIDYELPELIDSLVVTVEAGLGFTGALQLA